MGLDVIRSNIQMILLLLLWLVVGIYTGPFVYIFIPLTLFLIFINERYPELIIGFIFILIISDNLENSVVFAKSFKNIYIVLLFIFLLLSYKKQTNVVTIYKYFLLYFIFGAIGLLYSPVFFTSAQKLLSYILLFILVPNYIVKSYEKNGEYFFRELVYFLFAIIVIGFLLRFYDSELAFSHGGRLRGMFGNPNGLGIFMILTIIISTLVYQKFPYLFTRLEIIIFSIIMLFLLYKTGSRTALLAVVLFYIFNQIFRFSVFLGFLVFFSTLISIEFLILNFPKLILWLGIQDSFRLDTLEQGSGRLIAWEFAWHNIKQSMIIGKGFAYDEHLMRKNFELLSKAGHEGGVHNTYLIIWLNTGLFGLVSFLGGFLTLFIKGSRKNTYAFPAMFAIMLSISFEPWLASSLNPYTILFLIIITMLTEDIFNSTNDESDEMEDVAEMG